MGIDRIGVVGLGTMGRGIAQTALESGLSVVGLDVDAAHNEKGHASVVGQFDKAIERGKLDAGERDAMVARFSTTLSHDDLVDCDAVIEAITEDEAEKQALFGRVGVVVPADALLITNTSSLSVTALAAAADHPERVVGMHFFNPVPRMKLVEVVRALQSSDDAFERACELGAQLRKEIVRVKDTTAFLVNRALLPFLNEAIFELEQGIGTAEEIDMGMKLGLGHPMGPLELCDLIGLDTLLLVMDAMFESLGDSKYRVCPLLRKHVEAGWLGRKTGRGFHTYA